MLPAHVRSPDEAVYWLLSWFDELGAERLDPQNPVVIRRERSGSAAEVLAPGVVVHFSAGSRLVVKVFLDARLTPRRYVFDLFGADGRRQWGWHGHREPVGFHHRHDPPDFVARPAEPATFESVAALLHQV